MNIASIGADLRIHTWPNGQLLHVYKSNIQGFMKSLSWAKDGLWMVLVPSKGPTEVLSVRENVKRLHSIHEVYQPTCAAFQNSNKRNIAIGTATGAVFVYDVKSRNVGKFFPRAPSTVFKVEYCAKDSFLAAACESGEILLYNSTAYSLSSSYNVPNSRTVSNVRCHPVKRNLVVGGSHEGIVAMWDIQTTKLKFNSQAHSAPVVDLTFSAIHSDILVTVGLDLKLMFFDTSSNTCIMQKVIDRSSTAIDFCPDGIGLAVALQNGTIQTYDTRQMNRPLYMFTAHSGQIKQLVFQKTAYEEPCELSVRRNKVNLNIEARETARSGYSRDSPGLMFCGDFRSDILEATEVSGEDVDDSFSNGLHTKLNTTLPNDINRDTQLGIAHGDKNFLDVKSDLLEKKTHVNSSRSNQQINKEKSFQTDSRIKLVADNVKAQVSAPKFFQPELSQTSNISPSVTGPHHLNVSKLNQDDIEAIKSIVSKELKPKISALKHNLQDELYKIMEFARRQFLDLHMFIVKEFIRVEDHINKLKKDITAGDYFGEDLLVQENVRLRNEVQELRNQLLSDND